MKTRWAEAVYDMKLSAGGGESAHVRRPEQSRLQRTSNNESERATLTSCVVTHASCRGPSSASEDENHLATEPYSFVLAYIVKHSAVL